MALQEYNRKNSGIKSSICVLKRTLSSIFSVHWIAHRYYSLWKNEQSVDRKASFFIKTGITYSNTICRTFRILKYVCLQRFVVIWTVQFLFSFAFWIGHQHSAREKNVCKKIVPKLRESCITANDLSVVRLSFSFISRWCSVGLLIALNFSYLCVECSCLEVIWVPLSTLLVISGNYV